MKKILVAVVLFQSVLSFGQNCNCSKEFDFLVHKVESDYAGFNDKVNAKNAPTANNGTNACVSPPNTMINTPVAIERRIMPFTKTNRSPRLVN